MKHTPNHRTKQDDDATGNEADERPRGIEAIEEAHRTLDVILREQVERYHTPWTEERIVQPLKEFAHRQSARFQVRVPSDDPCTFSFVDRDDALALVERKRRALREMLIVWLADRRVAAALEDDSCPPWPLEDDGVDEACTMLKGEAEQVAATIADELYRRGHTVKVWARNLSEKGLAEWIDDERYHSRSYRDDARIRLARARTERDRAEDEARYLETARTVAARIDALDLDATEEHTNEQASDREHPGDGARTDNEQHRETRRRELWEELRALTDGCPHYVAGNALHAVWLRLARSIEERITVHLSWSRLHAGRIGKGLTTRTLEDGRELAHAKAELPKTEGTLTLLRHERSVRDEAREREAAANAAVRQRAGGGLLLAMPLISLARMIESLRLAGIVPRSVPLSDVSEHLWVRDSDTQNRGASLASSRAKMRTSNATDEHARTFVLALFYLLPLKQREELAAELTRIMRGVPPPEWEHYAE